MELAKEIATFMDNFDHWELLDSYGGVEEATMQIEDDLRNRKSRKGIRIFLKEVAEDDTNLFADRIMAAKLYKRIA